MQTPFSDFKATEMSNESIDGFFVSPRNMNRLYTPNATFVEGQRGTGKTMIMRYMANHPIIKDGRVRYLCIYLRFNPFVNGIELLTKNNDLFYHQLAITLTNLIIGRLASTISTQGWIYDKTSQLATVIAGSFYETGDGINSLDEISRYLDKKRIELMAYLRNPQNVKCPLICDYSEIYSKIVEIIHEDEHFSETTILFLLDEYENLKTEQKKAINAVIKSAEYGYTFKVFHRPFGLDSQSILDTHEYLKERDDYTVLNYYEDIIGGDKEYENLVKSILQKRLEIYYKKNMIEPPDNKTQIDAYLEEISHNEEMTEIVKNKKNYRKELIESFQHICEDSEWKSIKEYVESNIDLLDLKLLYTLVYKYKNGKYRSQISAREIVNEFKDHSEKYINWAHNYKTAIIYLTCFEISEHRKLCGLANIINISGGVVRNVLNTLHYVFLNASIDGNGIFNKATVKQQYNALSRVSEIAHDDIINIPEYGKSVLKLIEYLSYICQLYHRDPLLKKWEPNHFIITEKSGEIRKEDEQALEEVLNEACTWGQLVVLPQNKKKNKDEFALNGCSYGLHPVLSVFYGISWRRKQRCEVSATELFKATFGDGGEIRALKAAKNKEVLNNTLDYRDNTSYQITMDELSGDDA